MNWLFFALLAPFIYSFTNFIDKYVLERELKDYNALPLYTSMMGFLGGTMLWFFTGRPLLPAFDGGIILFTGVLTICAVVLYAKALSLEETSKIVLFFQMVPVFSLILAFLFLKETISLVQFLGFILIMASVIAVSYTPSKYQKFAFSKAFLLILGFDLIWAVVAVLIKFAAHANSFIKILTYESWGIGLGGVLIFLFLPYVRRPFLDSLGYLRGRGWIAIFLNESLFLFAKSCTYFAYAVGPVGLVSVLEGTQVFYTIVLAIILGVFFPQIFKEDVSRKALGQKIIFAILLFIGIVLISL